ncbi:MAG: 3-deoxy-manno-octulosonate cytidylyltransferase, partial [Pseudomonadota bacterium]
NRGHSSIKARRVHFPGPREHGLGVAMTDQGHQSGTDRCAEVATARGWDDDAVVVNLQGDEPLVPPGYLALAAEHAADADLATLAAPMNSEDWHDTNRVKVVCDAAGRALYFSRAPIPWHRDAATSPPPVAPLHHVGIYAYRVRTLARLTALPPTALERTESLEQLRALYHGLSIRVATVDALPGPGVDTPEDLDLVAQRLAQRGGDA